MNISCSLDKGKGGKTVEERKYGGMINYLLYLTASRSDIMFVVCLYAHFKQTPKNHTSMVKHIKRYLINMPLMGLWYPKETYCVLVGILLFQFH